MQQADVIIIFPAQSSWARRQHASQNKIARSLKTCAICIFTLFSRTEFPDPPPCLLSYTTQKRNWHKKNTGAAATAATAATAVDVVVSS